MSFWPRGLQYPTIVLEAGWSESWPKLCEDRCLWSEGSGFNVKLVILVKVSQPDPSGVVHSKVEITSYDGDSANTFKEVGYSFCCYQTS